MKSEPDRFPRGRLTPAAALGAALALLWQGGCTGGGNRAEVAGGTAPGGPPRQHAILQGIPMPGGFRLVPERSVARESGQSRVAMCEFEGDLAPEHVTAFYQTHMPTARFTLKRRALDNGEYKLRFESDTEECNIYVRRAKLRTVLVVDLGPLPRGSTAREIRPE